MKEYFIKVGKLKHPVSEQVYKAYYQCREHEAYLEKKTRNMEIPFSCYMLNDDGFDIDLVAETSTESVVDSIVRKLLIEKLLTCFDKLDEYDRMLIIELFVHETREQELASRLNIPRRTLRDRRNRILRLLKELLEI